MSVGHQLCVLQAVQPQNIQAEGKSTIHSLIQRISPFGFVKRQNGVPDEYGNHLCLDNMFEKPREEQASGSRGASYITSAHIDLEPEVIPEGLASPTTSRLQTVTVCHCDGKAAPVTYGISLGWDTTYGQFAEQVKETAAVPQGRQVSFLLLKSNFLQR